MNHVYAQKIDISNFRTFGPNFSLSIPSGPGLVIVYGMNGLGKTTFFEAIEWLLTGDVRRIREAMTSRSKLDNHLTRHGTEPNSHFVAVTFGPDNKRISRSVSQQPRLAELNQLLVSPDWTPQPEDISTYLRLTMFLPQARKFRFEEENPKDQWQLLRGPAGVDQLDVMRRALGGLPTKNAFDRVVSDLQAKLINQKRELDDWKELLEKRSQLANRVTDARMVTPEQAESFLSELPDQISSSGVSIEMSEQLEREGWTPERKLATVVQTLDATTDKIDNELETLRGFSDLIKEWIGVSNALESDTARTATLKMQLEEKEKKVTEAKQAVDQLRTLLEESQRQLAKVQEQRTIAEKAHEAFARLGEDRKTHSRLEQELTSLRSSVDALRRDIAQSEKIDQERKTLAEVRAGFVTERDKLITLGERVAVFDAANEKSAKTVAELKTLQDEQKDSIKLQEELESKIMQCEAEDGRLQQQKKVALVDAEAMTRALKIVCDHIAQDATTCPVCRAEYKGGEKLKMRAEQSVADAGIDTAQIDRLIQQNKAALNEHQEQLASVMNRIIELPPAINKLARQIDARTRESSEIEGEFVGLGYDSTTARERLHAATEAATKRINEIQDKTVNLPSVEDTRDQLDMSKAALVVSKNKMAISETAIGELETNIELDEAIVQAFRNQNNDSEADGDDIARSLKMWRSKGDASTTRADAAKRDYDKAEEEQLKVAAELQQLKALNETHSAAMTANQQRQTTLQGRWEQILDGAPDAISQQRAISERENTIEMIRNVRRQCSQTAERLDAWRKSNQSTDLDSSISQKLQSYENCSEAELTAKLELNVVDLQKEIDRVKDVKEHAIKLATSLQEKVDEFNNRALRPLATRIQRFHDVLSPFRYHIDWKARSVRGAMELRQSVSRESGSDAQSASPQVELSDGQMAVQGLSTLFAASTEYRWSRWPALLLDDPLQSSDLLHTSAFIDILRGLIANLGYQVFLSSHDMEEAKYIIRKCEHSGINVTKCHLLGPRSKGVRVDIS
tara:strand:- start:12853 stop:15930 length:3078 start_codon:yes stop_codon:yes gene_type:complete